MVEIGGAIGEMLRNQMDDAFRAALDFAAGEQQPAGHHPGESHLRE
jgi:hypothetical protein